MSEGKVEQSTPEQFNAYYKTLHEAPSDVLASRIVGSLILQKGNLVKYEGVIQHFIERYRAEEAAHAPSPSEATNYDICTIPTHHPNMQAEAYERGVRDAAKLVKRHSPECWTKFDEAAEEILALLQANPYRAVVETEAKKEER